MPRFPSTSLRVKRPRRYEFPGSRVEIAVRLRATLGAVDVKSDGRAGHCPNGYHHRQHVLPVGATAAHALDLRIGVSTSGVRSHRSDVALAFLNPLRYAGFVDNDQRALVGGNLDFFVADLRGSYERNLPEDARAICTANHSKRRVDCEIVRRGGGETERAAIHLGLNLVLILPERRLTIFQQIDLARANGQT